MEAKNGSFGFDFSGVYDGINKHEFIRGTLDDGRKVKIDFIAVGAETRVFETFETEKQNPNEMQRAGWLTILNKFKKYAETVR
jgi:hypothetical protein